MKSVSKVFNNVRTNVISFRVFSNITFGSFEEQRRKFGAQTIAKLFTSIFVTRITSGLQNILRRQTMDVYIKENYGLCDAHGMIKVVVIIDSGGNYY